MRLITLHDILTAWHVGHVTIEEALRLTRIDTVEQLIEAAKYSGLLPMDPPTPEGKELQALMNRILVPVGLPGIA